LTDWDAFESPEGILFNPPTFDPLNVELLWRALLAPTPIEVPLFEPMLFVLGGITPG
tara:strand:- start:472 stop:642 length:171 start_codon:yes stop_codon:yes gene_type:complete